MSNFVQYVVTTDRLNLCLYTIFIFFFSSGGNIGLSYYLIIIH